MIQYNTSGTDVIDQYLGTVLMLQINTSGINVAIHYLGTDATGWFLAALSSSRSVVVRLSVGPSVRPRAL